MPNLILRENLSNSASPLNIVLDDYIATSFTPSTSGEIYWRWEDDPAMDPQFLGATAAGTTLAVPFDLQGKEIRLFLVSKTADGRRSVTDVREAEQTTFQGPPLYSNIVMHEGAIVTHEGEIVTYTE